MQNSANTGSAQRDNHRHERLAAMKATIDALAGDHLTSHEATDLQAMREEEKIARDVYVQLFNKWSLRPFGNISGSEQVHMDMVKILLDRYELADPIEGLAIGKFETPSMQLLHDRLLNRGGQSEADAICVGLEIEELDIADLQAACARTIRPSILTVFGELERGSRNHLRAFERWRQSYGASYTPRHLTSLAFNAIALSPHEPCGV